MKNLEKEIFEFILAEMDMRNIEYLSNLDLSKEEIEKSQKEIEDVVFLYDIKKFENNNEAITECVEEMKRGLLKEGVNSFENIDFIKGINKWN